MFKNNFVEIARDVTIRDLTDKKYKTARISVHFILPLNIDTASQNALTVPIVTQSTKRQPSIADLTKYLYELYGAGFSASVSKIGDNQVLSIVASGISEKYALEGEKLIKDYTDLLCYAMFEPLTDEDGNFTAEAFSQERRELLELMDSEFNDKRIYALLKCQEIMFKGEKAEIRRYGTKETLENVSRESLREAWSNIIKTAKTEIFVMGDCDFSTVVDAFKSAYTIDREAVKLNSNTKLDASKVKNVEEEMQLVQSKLVMGFRTGVKSDNSIATNVCCTVLGGTGSSKLFLNVREKLSLCYYCSSSLRIEKSAMIIESGVETANLEKAKSAILEEIEQMKAGNITDDEIHFAKLALVTGCKAVGDSLRATENWYLNQVVREKIMSADEMEKAIMNISKEEVIEAANKLSLDTVYMLKGVMADE